MDKDTHKGITGIRYNSLNLPISIEIDNGSVKGRTKYVYSASGVKLQVTHETDMNPQTATVMGSAPFSTETTNTKVTDYVGNKIYEDGVLKKILVDGGYIDMETGEYHFYITDHLGNNRLVAKADGTVVQKNHYYPFGMEFAENSGDSDQPYKYNGKELDKMHGLNMYDYSARYYEPAIGRFITVDPLAEKYYSISPYAYVANNPIKFVDTDGRKIKIVNNAVGAMENIAKIAATTQGARVVNHLINSSNAYTLTATTFFWSSKYDDDNMDISYVGNP
ncbi:RHS repeat domain-containing protein [Dysgonomonas sp. BGC7]|uniref:RHS repeat domain-containing protein n=1 Tax=Dysgonomonas sp. BGC7 TaxID=1658008 RepID=UPI000680A003|nr:RHS repeat-associated core domain-containing protein [Dysgonomonas sp. BGC7]MBD8388704.1 RHS repeat-associated core domain-containing protein [Dysgonomonas sp. BGC7]